MKYQISWHGLMAPSNILHLKYEPNVYNIVNIKICAVKLFIYSTTYYKASAHRTHNPTA